MPFRPLPWNKVVDEHRVCALCLCWTQVLLIIGVLSWFLWARVNAGPVYLAEVNPDWGRMPNLTFCVDGATDASLVGVAALAAQGFGFDPQSNLMDQECSHKADLYPDKLVQVVAAQAQQRSESSDYKHDILPRWRFTLSTFKSEKCLNISLGDFAPSPGAGVVNNIAIMVLTRSLSPDLEVPKFVRVTYGLSDSQCNAAPNSVWFSMFGQRVGAARGGAEVEKAQTLMYMHSKPLLRWGLPESKQWLRGVERAKSKAAELSSQPHVNAEIVAPTYDLTKKCAPSVPVSTENAASGQRRPDRTNSSSEAGPESTRGQWGLKEWLRHVRARWHPMHWFFGAPQDVTLVVRDMGKWSTCIPLELLPDPLLKALARQLSFPTWFDEEYGEWVAPGAQFQVAGAGLFVLDTTVASVTAKSVWWHVSTLLAMVSGWCGLSYTIWLCFTRKALQRGNEQGRDIEFCCPIVCCPPATVSARECQEWPCRQELEDVGLQTRRQELDLPLLATTGQSARTARWSRR